MSDVETAVDGAQVAPVEAPEQGKSQEQAQVPTTEQVDTQEQDKPRDEKGRFVPQERVNEITRARREAERRVQYLEQQLASQQHSPQPQESTERAPTLAEHNYDVEAYTAATTQYAVKQAQRAAQAHFQQQSAQQHKQQIAQQFETRSRAYAVDHPDYEQAVSELGASVQFAPEIVEAIGYSEHGPAVAHYLAQHLDEADRIARLPPHLAAVQLGRIEAQVSSPKPKPVTNAPNPPPILGGGKATVAKNPDEMTQSEWLAWRNTNIKQGR